MVKGTTVQLSSGRGILRRPIQLLYPLEIHDEADAEEQELGTGEDCLQDQVAPTMNPEPRTNVDSTVNSGSIVKATDSLSKTTATTSTGRS